MKLNGPAERLDDGGIVRQRARRGDLRQTLFNEDQIAAVMLEIEVLPNPQPAAIRPPI